MTAKQLERIERAVALVLARQTATQCTEAYALGFEAGCAAILHRARDAAILAAEGVNPDGSLVPHHPLNRRPRYGRTRSR